MERNYILALDQGTTSSRAILFDRNGKVVCVRSREIKQIYPKPGWVEHDPLEIWASQLETARQAMQVVKARPDQIAGIGITNQRETTIIWERETGQPIYNAIVWQCRRTAEICEKLKQDKETKRFRSKTGLFIDAYFSGTKIKWILDHVPGAYERAGGGDLLFGTVDSWLVYNLTKGKIHITDFSNASRTMVFNIFERKWDSYILELLKIPPGILPEVRSSSEIYGYSDASWFGDEIPICGIAGDQQASLFGQTCFERGSGKNTYGTGCFMLMNIGEYPILSENGLITTIAWGLDGRVEYALEGSVFVAGAVIQWFRDELGMIQKADESASLALSVEDNGGVYLVPAFVGLGAPYWDMYARGIICGLTRGSSKAHIVRAALESIAFQSRDVLESMELDSGMKFQQLKVDGGASVNAFLMQFQADILGIPVVRAGVTETTALGAAYLAGLSIGLWHNRKEISEAWDAGNSFHPNMDQNLREKLREDWKRAVERSKRWLT